MWLDIFLASSSRSIITPASRYTSLVSVSFETQYLDLCCLSWLPMTYSEPCPLRTRDSLFSESASLLHLGKILLPSWFFVSEMHFGFQSLLFLFTQVLVLTITVAATLVHPINRPHSKSQVSGAPKSSATCKPWRHPIPSYISWSDFRRCGHQGIYPWLFGSYLIWIDLGNASPMYICSVRATAL